jgi:hypothetical protein
VRRGREGHVLGRAEIVDELVGRGEDVDGVAGWRGDAAAGGVVWSVVARVDGGGDAGRVGGELTWQSEVDGAGQETAAVLDADAVEGQHGRGPAPVGVGEVPGLAEATGQPPRGRIQGWTLAVVPGLLPGELQHRGAVGAVPGQEDMWEVVEQESGHVGGDEVAVERSLDCPWRGAGRLVLEEVGTASGPGGQSHATSGRAAGQEHGNGVVGPVGEAPQVRFGSALDTDVAGPDYRPGTEDALHHQRRPHRGADPATLGADNDDGPALARRSGVDVPLPGLADRRGRRRRQRCLGTADVVVAATVEHRHHQRPGKQEQQHREALEA